MSSQIKKGVLLTFEGIDGSGKSSAAQAVYAALSSHYNVILTREPGATPLGLSLRELVHHSPTPLCPRAEFLLFAADRAQHVTEVIIPHLSQGYIVISDRMADSSVAYQGYGRGLDKEFIMAVNAWALQGVRPAATLYLHVDYETARERIEKRAEKPTALEQEQAVFFKRVAQGFDTLFKDRSDVFSIDASMEKEQVHAFCIQRVVEFLTSRGL